MRTSAIAELEDLRAGQSEILKSGAGMALSTTHTGVLSAARIIDTYLHGYYLHAHNEKAALARTLDSLPPIARFTFYTVMFRLTKLYVIGANVVDLVLAEASLIEVTEPAA